MVLRKVLIVYQLITLVFLFGTWDRLLLVLVLGCLIKKNSISSLFGAFITDSTITD